MPLKTSYFNKGIFFNNIRRFWLVAFSYTFFLFLFTAGYLSSEISRLENSKALEVINSIGRNIFRQSNDIMPIFLGFYTIVAALAVFSYMQFSRNTAMVHSLPVSREALFMTNYLSGLFLVTFPVLFNGLMLIIAEMATGFPTLHDGWMWLGVNLVMTFLLYTFAVLAGMFTGHIAAQAIFFFIFNFLAVFLKSMIELALGDFLFGYVSNSGGAPHFEAWSPLYYMVETLLPSFSRGEGNVLVLIGYLMAGLIFLASSILLYRKRHMEVATDIISFPVVKPLFKYSATFCSSILLGNIIVSLLNLHFHLTAYIVAYLIGGWIGYFSCEMLLRKTFRVFKSYKGFVIFGIVLSFLILGTNFDLFGYEHHIPQDSEVELMCVSPHRDSRTRLALRPEDYDPDTDRYLINYYQDNNPPQFLTEAHIEELRNELTGIIDNREAITMARQLHDYIVRNEALFKENEARMRAAPDDEETRSKFVVRSLYFGYRLNDGTLIERQYYLTTTNNNTELDELLRKYLSISEVREHYEPILGKTADDIRGINVHFETVDGSYRNFEINENIQDFLTVYQKDILAQDSIGSMYSTSETRVFFIDINFEFKDEGLFELPSPSYSKYLVSEFVNTMNYLIENEIIDPEKLQQPEQIMKD